METYTFIAERGQSEENGIIYIDGLDISNAMCCFDFDPKQPICKPVVFIEDGVLKFRLPAEIALKYSHLYPAIGYEFKLKEDNIIKAARLVYIGLVARPNPDPLIKTLGEQIGIDNTEIVTK